MGLNRREVLHCVPVGVVPLLSGCSDKNGTSPVSIRMVQVINLSDKTLDITVLVSRSNEGDSRDILFSGEVEPQPEIDASEATNGPDGEITLPAETIAAPLEYDYILEIAGTEAAHLSSTDLQSEFDDWDSETEHSCLNVIFNIRDPSADGEIWADTEFSSGTCSPPADHQNAQGYC